MKLRYLFFLPLVFSSCAALDRLTDPESSASFPEAQAGGTAEIQRSTDLKKDAIIRKRIMIVQFLNRGKENDPKIAEYATSVVKEALAKRPEFSVIPIEEMEDTDSFINEFGELDEKEVFRKARLHNIAGIVVGTIIDLKANETGEEIGLFRTRYCSTTITIKLQLLDTATARELVSKTSSAEISEEHTDFFQNKERVKYDPEKGKTVAGRAIEKILSIIPDYARKIAWLGRIAKVDLHRYYISAGEMSGITRGQLLRVYDEGRVIEDPDTHTVLGVSPGRLKGMLKVIDFFGEDGAVAILYSGGGFHERDRVELFSSAQK